MSKNDSRKNGMPKLSKVKTPKSHISVLMSLRNTDDDPYVTFHIFQCCVLCGKHVLLVSMFLFIFMVDWVPPPPILGNWETWETFLSTQSSPHSGLRLYSRSICSWDFAEAKSIMIPTLLLVLSFYFLGNIDVKCPCFNPKRKTVFESSINLLPNCPIPGTLNPPKIIILKTPPKAKGSNPQSIDHDSQNSFYPMMNWSCSLEGILPLDRSCLLDRSLWWNEGSCLVAGSLRGIMFSGKNTDTWHNTICES